MRINKTFEITERRDHVVITNLFTGKRNQKFTETDSEYATLIKVLKVCRAYTVDNDEKNIKLSKIYAISGWFTSSEASDRLFDVTPISYEAPTNTDADTATVVATPNEAEVSAKKNAIKKLIDFFSEFSFAPSFRFVNTLAFVENPVDYVINYFAIMNHTYATEVADKVRSMEFKDIISTIKSGTKPSNVINNRMKLYFGEPGTGKTTKAVAEADMCTVCTSDMLPTDLMQNFAFSDGKAEFQKSDLWNAMEEGKTIVLDEINMLPFESLRFLQGITDGKTSFEYKGYTVNIKDGFNIIGTMNLTVGGSAMPIPEPLVDRCADVQKFTLSENDLISALI